MVEYRVKRVLVEGRDYDRFAALVPSDRFYHRVRLYHAHAPTTNANGNYRGRRPDRRMRRL